MYLWDCTLLSEQTIINDESDATVGDHIILHEGENWWMIITRYVINRGEETDN